MPVADWNLRRRRGALSALTVVVIAAVAVVAGTLLVGASQSPAAASFASFAGGWSAHGGGLVIKADGSFTMSLRTYRWCTDSPRPCDSIAGNVIIAGDTASGHLTSSSGNVATGVVTTTTDPSDTPMRTPTGLLRPARRLPPGPG